MVHTNSFTDPRQSLMDFLADGDKVHRQGSNQPGVLGASKRPARPLDGGRAREGRGDAAVAQDAVKARRQAEGTLPGARPSWQAEDVEWTSFVCQLLAI